MTRAGLERAYNVAGGFEGEGDSLRDWRIARPAFARDRLRVRPSACQVLEKATGRVLEAAPLAELGASPTSIELDQQPASTGVDAIVAEAAGRSLVIVVRNLHRHPWMVAVTEALLAQRPAAVTVEMGLPACRPAGSAAYIATHGAARVCGIAAAEVLIGR